jgi:hypothetical protein
VLLRLGSAYINFYDQPPKDTGRGIVHHLGIRTTDLATLVAHMKSHGFEFRKEVTELERLKYVMAAGPDGILLELFETDLLSDSARAQRSSHPDFTQEVALMRRCVWHSIPLTRAGSLDPRGGHSCALASSFKNPATSPSEHDCVDTCPFAHLPPRLDQKTLALSA